MWNWVFQDLQWLPRIIKLKAQILMAVVYNVLKSPTEF